jgi:ABC-2 type transport system permease protein
MASERFARFRSDDLGHVTLRALAFASRLACWLLLLGSGLVLSYCVWFAIVTLSVWFVKLESGAVAFDPVMQMARFPVEIYPARMRSFLTFALPVAFMTTFPTEALLGRTDVRVLVGGALFAFAMLLVSRRSSTSRCAFYGSASS